MGILHALSTKNMWYLNIEIYIYNLFILSFLTKHKKQYIKFDTKNTAIKTRIHNQDKNIYRNTNIYINIKTNNMQYIYNTSV